MVAFIYLMIVCINALPPKTGDHHLTTAHVRSRPGNAHRIIRTSTSERVSIRAVNIEDLGPLTNGIVAPIPYKAALAIRR